MNRARCTVIICAYTLERLDDLAAAVASVRAQTLPAHQMIVVSDHNDDLFNHVVNEMPDVLAVANHEARGLSGARNSGIDVATGDIVAFLDDDAVARSDWIERLVHGYGEEDVLGVGGAIHPIWHRELPRWFPEEFLWVVGCTYRGLPTSASPLRNMIGANMSFRRCVFEEIGGFRTGIGRIGDRPLGCEETELCIRARNRWPGKAILFDPQARVGHRVSEARTRPTYFWSRCYSEGLSKAIVSRIAGSDAGLSTERDYTLRILPLGAFRGIGDLMFGDVHGLLRSSFIATGLAVTVAGYLVGKLPALRFGQVGHA